MARKSGVLIRQLFGNCSSNPCAGLLHHRRELYSNAIQTGSPISTFWGLTPPSHFLCKVPLSSPNLHFERRSDSGLSFSSPPKMVIISNTDDYNGAIKQVKDGLLPAVFYFVSHRCSPVNTSASNLLHELRREFPHVTIYKRIMTPAVDMGKILLDMNTDLEPTFHCYQNGEFVAEIRRHQLEDAFEKFYKYVVPLETTQPTSSFGMVKRRAQQLAVESSTAPSLDEVMQAVESLPGGRSHSRLWLYAIGLFKDQPNKRVMFSNMHGTYLKVAWLLHQMAEE
ncbi:uncharacterized protein Pyn_04640 [Prunus yedoensis var. nudiflora]|uniref:Uncharacterized protein n=1 Tax=Prunus yedoensis var. nudiflora TaxID=2094558 RepID=A0A314ZGD3_PRUYE|nr:uncharacterized protein Pyn_04640 [Prunus yedoensis var. nudiflora]